MANNKKSKKATNNKVAETSAVVPVVVELDDNPRTSDQLTSEGFSLDGKTGRARPVTAEAIRLLRKRCGESGVVLHKHGLPKSLFAALIAKAVELKRQLNAAEALEVSSEFFARVAKNQEREQEWDYVTNDRVDESVPADFNCTCGCGTKVDKPRRRFIAIKDETTGQLTHVKYNFPPDNLLSVLNGLEKEIGAFVVPPNSNGSVEIVCFECLKRATKKLQEETGNPKVIVRSYPYDHAAKISEAVLARIERDQNRETNAEGLAASYKRRGRRDSMPRSWRHQMRVNVNRKLREDAEDEK